jgi:hypothetical protein
VTHPASDSGKAGDGFAADGHILPKDRPIRDACPNVSPALCGIRNLWPNRSRGAVSIIPNPREWLGAMEQRFCGAEEESRRAGVADRKLGSTGSNEISDTDC